MPRLRTDDGPRKLRAVWLGPAGHTLPFQWTYVQWAVTLIAVPIAGTIGTVIVWLLLRDPVWAFGLGGLWFGAGGVYLAIHLMRNVTFDEPLSYQRRLVKGEFNRQFSRPVGPRQIAVQFATPPIGYLSSPVLRAMGWDDPAQRPLTAHPAQDTAERTRTNPYLTAAAVLVPPTDPVRTAMPSTQTTPATSVPAAEAPKPNPYITTSPRT